MSRDKLFAWALVALTATFMIVEVNVEEGSAYPLTTFAFWIFLLIAVELLPVSLDFQTEVTMSFPIHLAVAMLFPPWVAMTIAGLAAFDIREIRREITLHHALFNRSQQMLSVGLASLMVTPYRSALDGSLDTSSNLIFGVAAAALVYTGTNLLFVGAWVHYRQKVPLLRAIADLPPRPMLGFWFSYVILAGVGTATAIVYTQIPSFGAWAVVAFILPLLFARLSIIGAREQQRLTQQLQERQAALLEATENVFREREAERHRIAEHIHDSSLQLLAAASYGCGNANDLIDSNQVADAKGLISSTREAIDEAIRVLRSSLVDLRKAAVEEGGLMQTITKYADQIQTLWGVQIEVDGAVDEEPPVSVALGAFQILQEGVNNALKHAESDRINVRINDSDGLVHVVVEDHGAGFDTGAHVGEDHVGMKLMRDRAEQLGGRLELDSEPGRGTRIEAILPGGVSR